MSLKNSMKPDESKFIKVKRNMYISKNDPDFSKKYLSENPDWQRVFNIPIDLPAEPNPDFVPLEFKLQPDYFEDESKHPWGMRKKLIVLGILGSFLLGSGLVFFYAAYQSQDPILATVFSYLNKLLLS